MSDQLLFWWEYKRGSPDRRFIAGCMALEKIPNTKLNAHGGFTPVSVAPQKYDNSSKR
jgi:hypothetical protein